MSSEQVPQFVAPMPELRSTAEATTVEVAASLGESVVVVRHLQPPRATPDRTPRVLAITAGILLALAAVAFAKGVRVAGANEKARQKWAYAGKAAGDFREEKIPPAWEGLGLSAVVLGLGCAVMALRGARDARRSSVFRVGSGLGADLALAGVAPHALVRASITGWELAPLPGLAGSIVRGGIETPLPRDAIALQPGDKVRALIEGVSLHVAVVDAPPPATAFVGGTVDSSVVAFASVSVAAHVAVLALLYAVPPEGRVFLGKDYVESLRQAKVDLRPAEDRLKELEKKLREKHGGDGKEAESGKAGQGPQGKMGSVDSKRATGRFAITRRADKPQLTRYDAQAAGSSAGMLGLFHHQPKSFAAINGTALFPSGLSDRDVYGGLIGDEIADASGGWASGLEGNDHGGGGTGLDTVGLGPDGGFTGTIGNCKQNCGYGPGRDGFIGGLAPKHAAGPPPPKLGQVSSLGDLDPSVIRRYVRMHLPEITHCYERELVVKPTLEGTVDVQFTIGGTGDVMSVGARGIDPNVDQCVSGVIGAIKFPQPEGAGIVRVTSYPFTFNAP